MVIAWLIKIIVFFITLLFGEVEYHWAGFLSLKLKL